MYTLIIIVQQANTSLFANNMSVKYEIRKSESNISFNYIIQFLHVLDFY